MEDQDVEELCLAEINTVLAKHGCQMTAAPVFQATVGGFYGVKVNVQVEKIKGKVLRPDVDLRGVMKNLVAVKAP